MTVAALYNGLRAAEELEVASSAPPALPVSFGTAREMARDLLSAMADFAPFAPSAAGIPLAAPERDRRAVYRAAPSARTEARTP